MEKKVTIHDIAKEQAFQLQLYPMLLITRKAKQLVMKPKIKSGM